MVYVTHDQVEAMTLGDRVALLRRGVVQQVASPKELYLSPANIFVAGFIGSPAMNFFPAKVENGRVRLPMVEYDLPEHIRRARTCPRVGQGHRRHPARALRGHRARRPGRSATKVSASPPRSTAWSGSAPSCSCTSR